jgi:TolA-binding protein
MLRPTKKITKREIKEDPLVTFYVRVQKFLQNYSKQLNIGFIALAAIIIIGVFVIRSKNRANVAASGRLGIAEQFYASMNYSRAIDEFNSIVTTYSGTKAAGRASFFLANAYFEQKDYENAENYYRLYLDDYGSNHMLYASSLAGIAACMESRNQFTEAASLYEKAAKKYSDSFQAPYYLKDAGRCYVNDGNSEEGKRVFEAIKNKYAESPIIQEINEILETL